MTVILRRGISVVFPKCIVQEYNPSTRTFNIAVVERSYMFRLLQSNRYQAVRFGIAEIFNCNVQLLYESCEFTDYILLFYVNLTVITCGPTVFFRIQETALKSSLVLNLLIGFGET